MKAMSEAINAGVAAGIVCTQPEFSFDPDKEIESNPNLHLMGMLFYSLTSQERIYKEQGLEAFLEHRKD